MKQKTRGLGSKYNKKETMHKGATMMVEFKQNTGN